jgi:hypothetical protein
VVSSADAVKYAVLGVGIDDVLSTAPIDVVLALIIIRFGLNPSHLISSHVHFHM